MALNIVDKIDGRVRVRNILVSVSDKRGLDFLIPSLLEINPDLRIISTGGTYNKIGEILGKRAESCLIPVSEYTGQPETQGGLVKTLDFKIYLGLLTEKYNEDHQEDLKRTNAVPLDMVVVNLYPFQDAISKENVTVENARTNIDIGGPCMVRASAKNFLRVASIVDPDDYKMVVSELEKSAGHTSLDLRFRLARKAFAHTAQYDKAISEYFMDRSIQDDVETCYKSL